MISIPEYGVPLTLEWYRWEDDDKSIYVESTLVQVMHKMVIELAKLYEYCKEDEFLTVGRVELGDNRVEETGGKKKAAIKKIDSSLLTWSLQISWLRSRGLYQVENLEIEKDDEEDNGDILKQGMILVDKS